MLIVENFVNNWTIEDKAYEEEKQCLRKVLLSNSMAQALTRRSLRMGNGKKSHFLLFDDTMLVKKRNVETANNLKKAISLVGSNTELRVILRVAPGPFLKDDPIEGHLVVFKGLFLTIVEH
ncbi:hypothetical protein HYC85_012407 [Camellia sinensis]|uniref:Uncharacterized protein n=1 Tax=Camellia sinensis TaxID=4442 RepID=A0A7J7HES2_CAMSI|nr:hypothetical protein HYC85_012407 [Camellia sinensis]